MSSVPIPIISQQAQSTTVVIQRGSVNGNQYNDTESQTNELHQQIRDLADAFAKKIFLLNDQAEAAIWKEKDSGLASIHVINRDCCKILDLTEGTSTTTGLRCTENDLNELLNLLKNDNPAYKTKIEKFNRRQWVLAMLDIEASKPLGRLLREPKVFNYLYTYINLNTGSQKTGSLQSELAPTVKPAHSPQTITVKQQQMNRTKQKEEDEDEDEDGDDEDFWIDKAYEASRGMTNLKKRSIYKDRASWQAPDNNHTNTTTLLRQILASLNKLGATTKLILENLGGNNTNTEQVKLASAKTNQNKKAAPQSESTPPPDPKDPPTPKDLIDAMHNLLNRK